MVDEPYAASREPHTPPRRGWGLLWTGVALVVLGPAVGLAGTVLGMLQSFRKIEEMKAPAPGDLAEGVYASTVATTFGVLAGLVGVGLVIAGLVCVSRTPGTHPESG